MYNVVHVDEKRFNLYKSSTRFYLSPNEPLLYRSTPNKRYIGKVMFLAAVARSRYDFHKKRRFDGKTGIWPIIEVVPANRSSANRPAGTPVVQNISMIRDVYIRMLKEKVFPAIRKLIPEKKNGVIRLQQDNAGPHVSVDHADILEAGREGALRIEVICQPPRSPDLSVLDLGLFSFMQSLQYQRETRTTQALINAVTNAFYSVPAETINKTFLTLQKVMESVIVHEGSNDFPLPRSSLRRGVQPTSLTVSTEVRNGLNALKSMNK